MSDFDTGAEHWGYVYTADDERLIALLDDATNPLTNWTVRGFGNEVLTRDDHFPAAGSPPPVPPGPCPDPTNAIFCDGFESGTVGAWSSNSGLDTRTTTDYIHRDGQLLATSTLAGGGAQHFSLDHLGTPRVVTDEIEGTVLATHTYFPFGEEATPTDQDAEPRKFTGHERDLQTTAPNTADDLDYMHARFRSPLTGRFLSIDSARASARPGMPQSWNRYCYTVDNPLRYVDRDGKVWDTFIDVAVVGYDIYNLFSHPSWSTAGSLGVDVAFAALPFIPNVAALRHIDALKAGIQATETGARVAPIATKLANIFTHNLDRATIIAAGREAAGHVVATKAGGQAFDHLTKYQEARQGAAEALSKLQGLAADERLSDAEHAFVKYLLSTYSKSLDEAEKLFAQAVESASRM